jgi:membrane protein
MTTGSMSARAEAGELTDLSFRDYVGIVYRGIRRALAGNVTNLAAAVAYYGFLAIPSALLVAVGAFSVLAGPDTVRTILDHLSTVMPQSTINLLGDTLTRTTQAQNGGLIMIVVGVLLALWTLSGAMQTVMWALNAAYERDETRGFVKRRVVAVGLIVAVVVSVALVFVLLILGPHVSEWVGSAVGNETAVRWVWWTAQWPILLVGLLTMFAFVLYLGPNVVPRKWQFITPGALFAVVVWLAASGLFAFYTSNFASYNKAWGSLAAVIVMLTWLWISALALLVGGEINAELQRCRRINPEAPAPPEE